MNRHDEYRYNQAKRRINGTRWAEDDEIRGSLTPVWLRDAHYPACGLPLVSDGRTAWVDPTDSHSLILGSTGSKKTRLLAMPMMNIIARSGESVVCTDPKGELYERTSGLFAQEGYRIQVINLRDPLRSNGWNPLRIAQEYYLSGERERAISLINDLAETLFPRKDAGNDPFWQVSAKALFEGLCDMMLEGARMFPGEYCGLATLRRLSEALTCPDYSHTGATNRLSALYPLSSMAQANLNGIVSSAERTFRSIVVSYNTPMQLLYSQDSVIRLLSTMEVDFSTLGTEKTALYLIMPDEKTTLHGIVSLVIKQCYETLIHTAQQRDDRVLPLRVNFLLDEFANLPAIPDMNAMISAARSRNIRFYLVVQSMSQLRGKYADDAYTIRGNCENWVFLASRELELLQELEALCGVNQATGEALISVSQLQRLNKETGEALLLRGRSYPYITHLADIDEYPCAALPPAPLPDLPGRDRPMLTPNLDALAEIVDVLQNMGTDLFGDPMEPIFSEPPKGMGNSVKEGIGEIIRQLRLVIGRIRLWLSLPAGQLKQTFQTQKKLLSDPLEDCRLDCLYLYMSLHRLTPRPAELPRLPDALLRGYAVCRDILNDIETADRQSKGEDDGDDEFGLDSIFGSSRSSNRGKEVDFTELLEGFQKKLKEMLVELHGLSRP